MYPCLSCSMLLCEPHYVGLQLIRTSASVSLLVGLKVCSTFLGSNIAFHFFFLISNNFHDPNSSRIERVITVSFPLTLLNSLSIPTQLFGSGRYRRTESELGPLQPRP